MLNKNNCIMIAGVAAAVVTVLSVGGYILHRIASKRRLEQQDMDDYYYDDYYDDEYYDDDDYYYDDEDYVDVEVE